MDSSRARENRKPASPAGPLGRLPGDIVVRRGAFSFAFPLTTCVLLSVVITVLLALFRR